MSIGDLMRPVPGVEPSKSGLYLWRYAPNLGAALLFLILFMGSCIYISWKTWQTRIWFCTVFAIGCFLEMLGYGIRAGARNNTGKLMPFVVQNAFILVAPVLFAASVYMTLGRIIVRVNGERLSIVKPSKITLTFVMGDVLSFLVQGGGAGMSVVQKPGFAEWAQRIIIIGLVIQIVLFAVFCVVCMVFHWKMNREARNGWSERVPWKSGLRMLYAVSLLIMIRSIFRVAEYCQGQTGYALSHEWTLYVFDSLLMFAASVIFAFKFPSNYSAKTVDDIEDIPLHS